MENVKQWSFSGLKQYLNCPRAYQEIRVLERFKQKETKQTRTGKAIHKVIEDYVNNDLELPDSKLVKRVPEIVAYLPAMRHAEVNLGMTKEGEKCEFHSQDVWLRGVIDLFAVESDCKTAYVVDWKTGSMDYADTKQLDAMALLVFVNFPQIDLIKSMLYFLRNNRPVFGKDRHRSQIEDILKIFTEPLTKLDASYKHDNWPMIPSGLCGFCPVDICPHWKPRRD